jgi:hypothetical protein
MSHCDAGLSHRDAGLSHRDAVSSRRDAGLSHRDAVSSRRDAGLSHRDAVSSRRDAVSSRRDAGSSRRDAGSSRRDAGLSPPPDEAVIAIPREGRDAGRPRVFLRIGLGDASSIGSFETGPMDVSTVIMMPGDKQLFVSAKGAGYIIDLKTRTQPPGETPRRMQARTPALRGPPYCAIDTAVID